MKWRCTWCGKPHARNDPPCESCGHHKFEKAVVPIAPEDPDHVPEPVWVCPECGREHQRNAPPCSRCGNPSLEQRRPDYADLDEIGSTSYLDLLSPRYVAALALTLVAGTVLVLALAGVITLPGMTGDSLAVDDVPGEANVSSALALSAVEDAYLEGRNDRRESAGEERLTRNDRLDEVSRFVNQRWVKSEYGEGSLPDGERVREATGDACEGRPTAERFVFGEEGAAQSFETERALGGALADALGDEDGRRAGPDGRVGADVHVAPDGQIYVTTVLC